jgi:protein pelota
MKQLSLSVDKDGSGTIKLQADESEDMWHVYNILLPGDLLRASTVRRVVQETQTGSTTKSTHRVMLKIKVEDIFFDTQQTCLRVNGKCVEENSFVKMGAYHTIDLEQNQPFTITKLEWDSISLNRIKTACDVTKRADIAAVVMEDGIAHICLVTENMTLIRLKIESNIPRKRYKKFNFRRGTSTDHDKGLIRFTIINERFFDLIVDGISRHVDFNVVKVLIIASPGFLKDSFYKHLMGSYI